MPRLVQNVVELVGDTPGISAGAAVYAAQEVARELGEDKNVVTVLPDTGERYFSLEEYFTEVAL